VARDSKYRSPPEAPTASFYGSIEQMFWSGHSNFFYIRTSMSPEAAAGVLRREAAALGLGQGLFETARLAEYTEAGLFAERVAAALLSALGLLALTLAAVGLYSVMAYAVRERTHEIGIRMALGAPPRGVLGMILRKGLGMTLAGVAVGAAGSYAGARVISNTANVPIAVAEPGVFAIAACFLVAVAMVAAYLPARRAMRVDPLIALRTE
jgi:predicted lysophospholipase L1 biosynthesis ABC-type transport system permease subunit